MDDNFVEICPFVLSLQGSFYNSYFNVVRANISSVITNNRSDYFNQFEQFDRSVRHMGREKYLWMIM